MGIEKYYYVLEDEGKPTPVLEFDVTPEMPANLAQYLSSLLQSGPVIFYGTEEQVNSLKKSGMAVLQVDETTAAITLRNLD